MRTKVYCDMTGVVTVYMYVVVLCCVLLCRAVILLFVLLVVFEKQKHNEMYIIIRILISMSLLEIMLQYTGNIYYSIVLSIVYGIITKCCCTCIHDTSCRYQDVHYSHI